VRNDTPLRSTQDSPIQWVTASRVAPLEYTDANSDGQVEIAQQVTDLISALLSGGDLPTDGEVTGVGALPDNTLHGLFPEGLDY